MKKLFYVLVLLLVLFSIVVIPAKAGGSMPLIPCLKESENIICNDGNVYNGFFGMGHGFQAIQHLKPNFYEYLMFQLDRR